MPRGTEPADSRGRRDVGTAGVGAVRGTETSVGESDAPEGRDDDHGGVETASGTEPAVTTDGGSVHKVLGEIDAPDGVGLLGRNTATTGAAHGVRGRSLSPEGYGIYTPDDARVDGTFAIDGSRLFVQDTEPANPDVGDVWIDTA